MHLHIHNAKKVTFDGRDCFILSLLDDRGNLLFDPQRKRYDPEATSEHTTLPEAITAARELAKRRGVPSITVERGNGLPPEKIIPG